MEFLNKILAKDPDYALFLKDIKSGRIPIACTGLSGIHKAAILSVLFKDTGQKITVITQDEAAAKELADDIAIFGIRTINFPLRDYCIGNLSGFSREYEHKRTDTLSAIADGDFDLLTLSIDAALQYTIPKEALSAARFALKTGDEISTSALTERLLNAGYSRSEICEGAGQFAVRGGIFDLFPITCTSPCRIEFWGDEIDNIYLYDPETQRRTDSVESIEITPASEIIYNREELANTLCEYLKTAKRLTENQKNRISADIDAINNGVFIPPDRYLPFIYPSRDSVLDYVSDTLIFISESGNISERFKSMQIQQSADIENLLEEGFLSSATAKLWLDRADFDRKTENAVMLENFPRTSYDAKIKDIVNFNYKRSSAWGGDLGVLTEDIAYITEQKGAVVILAGEERAAKVLTSELNEKGIPAVFIK